MDSDLVYELIGYAGSALVVLSLMQRSILRLRVIGLIGSVVFLVYSLLIGAYPGYFRVEMQNDQLLTVAVLDASKSRGEQTFGEIVSRVAPHGAATLEDLPLLDTTNPNEWLLMVAVREGDRTQIFRKLYDFGETASVKALPTGAGR